MLFGSFLILLNLSIQIGDFVIIDFGNFLYTSLLTHMKQENMEVMETVSGKSTLLDLLSKPLYKIDEPLFKSNKLIDKHVPAVSVDTNRNIIKCQDADVEVAVVRASHSLSTNYIVAYFQVEILSCQNDCGLNIGLTSKDGNPRSLAGKHLNSVGYFGGDIFLNKKKVGNIGRVKRNDRVGCGINCANMTFFFTKNKQIAIEGIQMQDTKWNEFYPAIQALQNLDESVQCYFQSYEFVFDINSFSKKIEQQVNAQINSLETKESEVYSLISEYMLFNGYSKTLEMLKQSKDQIDFQPINKLTKNLNKKIDIDLDQQQQIETQKQQLMGLEPMNQEEMQEQVKLEESRRRKKMRERIMSENINLIGSQNSMMEEINEPRRKNTQTIEPEKALNMRKQSNLSDLSQVDELSLLNRKNQSFPNLNFLQLQKKADQNQLTLNEKFLLNERLQILEHLKQERIEQAQKIIKEKIPKLYQIQPMLDGYMKGHIFLRKIKEEGGKNAIQYARNQADLSKYIDNFFPTYDKQSGAIEMIPFKKIFTAVPKEKSRDHRLLQKDQAQYFTQFINRMIMKSMGIMGNSRLGMIMEHTQVTLRKLQEFKGMPCGIELMF